MTAAHHGPRADGHDDRGDVARLGTILSIWAHPDDETYGCAGIMARAVENGQRVVCVSATAGELGTPDPVAWPPERLARMRRWEVAAAMAVLGVTDHRILGYPDGGLAAMDPAEPIERLTEIIREVQPDTTLTFDPDGGTFHPDHQTISAWTGKAWLAAGSPGRLYHSVLTAEHLERWAAEYEKWDVFMSDERPVGVPEADLAIRLVLDGAELDQKMAALSAMATQIAPLVAAVGEEAFREANYAESYVDVTDTAGFRET